MDKASPPSPSQARHTSCRRILAEKNLQELPASCRSFAGADEGNRTLVSSACDMRGPTSRSPSFKLLICLWSHNARFQRIKAELRQRRLKRTPKFRRQNLIQV